DFHVTGVQTCALPISPATTMETSNSPNPQPGSTTPNAATGASNDKLFIVLAHLSPFLGVGIILPLIIWLVKKSEADNVAYHAKRSEERRAGKARQCGW